MQECRTTRRAAVIDGARDLFVALRDVETIRVEIIEIAAVAEIRADPVRRRLHRNADAVVFADEQHGRRQFLIRRPRSGVERGLRGRVVRRMHRRTNRSRSNRPGIGSACAMRLPCSIAMAVPSAFGRCEAIVDVCGNTHSGLLPHTLWRPPDAGSSLLAAKLSAESMIGSMPGQFTETFRHERAGTVMQERGIGMTRQPRDHRVAFVAARSDRVEHLVLHAQHARHQIEMTADQLRIEQFDEIATRGRDCSATSAHRRPTSLFRRCLPVCTNSLKF